MNIMKMIGLVATSLLVVGCASKPSVMTADEFERLPPDEQEAVLVDLEARPARIERFREAQLRAEKPVVFEYDGIGYKMQCIKYPGGNYAELVTYHGQDAPSLSRASHQALAVIAANGDCTPRLRDAGNGVMLPVTTRNDAGMSEGFLRAMLVRTVPAVLNGTGAVALRHRLGPDCGDGGCAPTFNVISQAVSGSESNAQSGADIKIDAGVCPGGNCVGPPDH
jgi:hypothetical protein